MSSISSVVYSSPSSLYYSPLVHVLFSDQQSAEMFKSSFCSIVEFKEVDTNKTECKAKGKIDRKRMKISDESAYNDKTTVELKEILEQKKQEMIKSQEKMGGKDAERMTEMAKLTRYYGDKVQTLITEMQKDNPIDESTGEYTSIKKIIESFKLDKELIKWDDNEEDFKPFD